MEKKRNVGNVNPLKYCCTSTGEDDDDDDDDNK